MPHIYTYAREVKKLLDYLKAPVSQGSFEEYYRQFEKVKSLTQEILLTE